VADEARTLLNYLVRRYIVHDELVAIDLDASASDLAETIEADKQEAAQRELNRAKVLGDAFAIGLKRAHRQRLAGEEELTLDDRDAEENAIADALISFLVSYQLASSRSEETEPHHYLYSIAIDWDGLETIAREAGVDLEQVVQGPV
jgi:hypothetical protein